MQRFTDKRPRRRVMDAIASTSVDEDFDPVTGLATRAKFHARAETEWNRRCKNHGPMTLMLITIDRFDAYRSAQGDTAANDCLSKIAGIIAKTCRRRGDFAGRLRDHNFAVLLSETAPKGALALAEKIRSEVKALDLGEVASESSIRVSVSVASTLARSNRFVDSLLKMADDGLGEAADKGGDCVVCVRGDKES